MHSMDCLWSIHCLKSSFVSHQQIQSLELAGVDNLIEIRVNVEESMMTSLYSDQSHAAPFSRWFDPLHQGIAFEMIP